MHPRYEVEREYAVRVMGRMTDEQRQQLLAGIELEDGPAKCEKVEDGGGDDDSANHWYNVTLKEGRNRDVRRLFEALGLAVSRLIRVRYGRIAMPSTLKRGDVTELEPQDVNALLRSIGMKPNAGAGQAPAEGQPRAQRPPGQHAANNAKGPRSGQRGRRRGPGAPPLQRNEGAPGQPGGHPQRGQGGPMRQPNAGNAQPNARGPAGGPRSGTPGNKRRGRKGQGFSAGAGGGPGRRGPAPAEAGNSAYPGAQRQGKKRRPGRGVKNSSNVSAQLGVARDRRVGQKPRGADGRPPPMPVVTHKKSRRSSLLAVEAAPPGPRDDDE